MQPLAQSILLEKFSATPSSGTAMVRLWLVGVIVAPVIGPTLGRMITDSVLLRWIFYINLPVACWPLSWSTFTSKTRLICARSFRGGNRLSRLWPVGSLAGLFATRAGQGAGRRIGSRLHGVCWTAAISTAALVAFIIPRTHGSRTDRAVCAILLDRNFAVERLITCTYALFFMGRPRPAAATCFFANPAGIFGVAKRPLGESTGDRLDGFDDRGRPSGALHRWPLADCVSALACSAALHMDCWARSFSQHLQDSRGCLPPGLFPCRKNLGFNRARGFSHLLKTK